MNSEDPRPYVCQHGSFRRSCELCERDAEIARLLPYEAAAKEWVASLDDFERVSASAGRYAIEFFTCRPGLLTLYRLVKEAKP